LKRKKELDVPKAIKGMSDSQLYKQAGNSMTTKVVKGILKNILNCIFEVSPL
jgi:site-specific DNA-cytosine methylase